MGSQNMAISQQIDQVLQQLEQQGLLDDQFAQLRQLQDDSNPDFVSEVVELYFEDSDAKIRSLGAQLQAPSVDFGAIDQLVHQFKGSSASFGARAIAELCVALREACLRGDAGGCRQLLQQLVRGFQVLRSSLEGFVKLEAQRKQLTS